MATEQIPVIIVSGYLGAGKTTLIRDFLIDPQGLRATVLVNDFGQVNIDAELIAETGADTIALTNGCACCSIGDDLLGAATGAMATRPDLLVIEASGVAQPARMARLLRGVAGTSPARCLTVVNGARAQQLSRDKFVSKLFEQQIHQSDALSLNRDDCRLPGWIETRPNVPSLTEFIRFAAARQDSPILTAQAATAQDLPLQELPVKFIQKIHHPPKMDKAAFQIWLLEQCPTLHRAKGVFPLQLSADETVMARIDYVQGELSIQPLPERNCAPLGQIVVIAPAMPHA